MKNKRVTTAILSAIFGVSVCAGLAACGGKDDGKNIQYVEPVPQTCTTPGHSGYYTDGEKYYSDENGNEEITLDSVRIEPDGHTEEATWKSDGINHWHNCSVCDTKIDSTEVAHTEDDTAWKTDGISHWHNCSVCDAKVDSTEVAHTEEAAWQRDESNHWHNCSECDAKVDGTEDEHEYVWTQVTAPTATKPGKKNGACTCGATQSDVEIPALGAGTHHKKVDATCVDDGIAEYWENNGVKYSDEDCSQVITDTVIPATGIHTADEATWKSDGINHWHNCSVCDTKIDSTEVAHTEDDTAWKTDGISHWHNCSVCDAKVDSTEVAHTEEAAWQRDESNHWHNCSECDAKVVDTEAVHKYSDTVVAPTCTDQGHTDHKCDDCGYSYSDGTVDALGHSYGDKTVFDIADGKFYRVCENGCGIHGDEVSHYSDRYITVNGTKYVVADCYAEANLGKGITYDPVKQEFTIHITDNYSGDLAVATKDEHVNLSVEKDVSLTSITFVDDFGGDHNLRIIGSNKLTVTTGISVATALIIESDVDLPAIKVGDSGQNNKVVIGNAENSVSPTVTITTAAGGVESNGNFDLDYKVLSGKLTIVQSASGNCGISFHRPGDAVEIGEHGTLEINGFEIGLAAWDSAVNAANIRVYGTLNINASPNDTEGAITSLLVTVGDAERSGKLNVVSGKWGIMGGKLSLVKGSAELKYLNPSNPSDSGYASFNNVTELIIKSGFNCSIVNFSIGVFGNAPTLNIDEGVTIAIVNMRDSNNDNALKAYYRQG